MEQIFFSKQNFNIIYKIISKKIKTITQYDINNDGNFNKQLVSIMRTVYHSKDKFKIDNDISDMDYSRFLSQKVINMSVEYFIDIINKNNNNSKKIIDRQINTNQKNINYISPRPISNISNNNNISENYEKILNSRNSENNNLPKPIDFSKNNIQSNNDIQKKYEEYTRERNGEYENKDSLIEQQFEKNNNLELGNKLNEQIINDNGKNKQSYLSSPQINPNVSLQITNFEANEKNLDNSALNNNNFSMDPDDFDLDTLDTLEPIENNNIIDNLNLSNENKLDDNITHEESINSKNEIMENKDKDLVNTINYESILEIIKKQQEGINNTNNKLESLVNIMEKQDLDKFYNTVINIPNLIKKQKQDQFTYKKHIILISSKDRELSNNEFNKYSFKINFGGNTNDTTIKSNFNSSSSSNSSQLKNNTEINTKYSSSIPKNPAISEVLRNIVSIKITRVIIPRPRDKIYYPEPYYFIALDEFDSNILTSKQFNEKIFCKIHFDKEIVFGGIGDSSIPINNEDNTQNESGTLDDGRKYLYYKNDDDEGTFFYHAPLAKLNNLTIKILDSRGRILSETWKDSDFYSNSNKSGTGPYTFSCNTNFINNTFLKDEIVTIDSNLNSQDSRIISIDKDNSTISVNDDIGNENGNTLINLNNQIEYVFEVKTKEFDIDSKFTSEIL